MSKIINFIFSVKLNQASFDPFEGGSLEHMEGDYPDDNPYTDETPEERQIKQRDEEGLAEEIFKHMQELEFNSLAFYFSKVPVADLSHLRIREFPGQFEVAKNYNERLVEQMAKTIIDLEQEKVDELGENLEDGKHSNNDNYYEKKLDNLKEIRNNFLELAHIDYKHTYLKFNNQRQFCDQLPIYCRKAQFMKAFQENQVIILQSTAGSGKSTQIPQYILEISEGRTCITEPRAIAVESVANRVHAELSSCLAPEGIIGYLCGPNFNIKALSKVIYMTEHEFMSQFLRDKQEFLDCFDTFVIDEAHELRKPQLVILAVLRNLIRENPKKKIIVTSATLEADLFKNYFEEFTTALISAETPTFGVEIIDNQFPDLESNTADNTVAHVKVILDHIKKNHNKKIKMPNVLVFLPSIPEIKKVIEKQAEDAELKLIKEEIHVMFEEFHGALTPKEKNDVLDPPHKMHDTVRIILATNIAETAVTIDNIMYVLDSGREREFYQDQITSLSYMREEQISKSSALQRKGRAGRICKGYCYRMFTEGDYQNFEPQKKPEIVRMDISDLILLSCELNDYFVMADLLFYPKIEQKIITVASMLNSKGCFKIEGEKQVLSLKGKFIIESNLQPNSAAFLYENLKMNNQLYGLIATVILEKPSGYFKNNEILRTLVEKEMGYDSSLLKSLGDLAPMLYLINEYDNLIKKYKDFSKQFGVLPSDMRRIQTDIKKLS